MRATERFEKAEREEHARRMQYILQGYQPPTNQHGITIPMSVAMATGMVLQRRAPRRRSASFHPRSNSASRDQSNDPGAD
ncbi:hypothetical protein [Bradyrhizobium sp. CB2312]|uniref:hypothetical protein n=1 Tax=Bradyrhizobium sp. CB2312 TaxID=3039155 RepID=UPI0024B27FEE|nr:hypothetical protein [Bradyrhizobium sp. CB2312]WFU69195.1 hypothetical protein QA642_28305 [Bradyrhizobium sp. CB2312]